MRNKWFIIKCSDGELKIMSQYFKDNPTPNSILILKLIKTNIPDDKEKKNMTRMIEFKELEFQRKEESYFMNLATNMHKSIIKICSNCLLSGEPINYGWIKRETKGYVKMFVKLPTGIKRDFKNHFYRILSKVTDEDYMDSYFYGMTKSDLRFSAKYGYRRDQFGAKTL